MAIIFKDNKKKSKVNHDYNYGGFWLGDAASNFEYEGRTAASSVVKALKLRNYQKAIGNFVKILSQKDVPVVVKGTDSYTDGNQVVIAGNVNDKNFDITAGLALHEASHLKYTDFKVLREYMKDSNWDTHKMRVKNMLNWIEDRRIDTIVFKSCPGYKAYYHKLYDHYFRCKEVAKMLKGKQYRVETYDNYEAHIINMMNSVFDKNALEVLPEVTALINVNKISRLKNTAETLALAEEVVKLIEAHLESLAQQQQDPDNEDQEQEQEDQPNAGQAENDEEQEGDDQEGDDQEDDEESGEEEDNNAGGGAGANGSGEPTEEEDDTQELSVADMAKIAKKLQEQEQMINGDVEKKNAAKAIAKKLGEMQNSEVDYTSVGEGRYKNDALVYRLDKEQNKIASLYTHRVAVEQGRQDYQNDKITREEYSEIKRSGNGAEKNLPAGLEGQWRRRFNTEMVSEGLQLGTVLGKKLQTRRESRELVTNRLRTGKIDAKRIAHAGYGIENIFNQIHIDKYKNANIHLTIDASGSMGGERWMNSIKLAMAIGKAVSMIEGLDLQVSMRETDLGDTPVVSIVYDSRANKLNHLKMALEMYQPNSMTPEGLCIEAMMKKNLLVPNNSECDSYLINICDGCPGAGSYGGYSAVMHTKKQVRKLNMDLGIKSIGYFFGSEAGYGWSRFQEMYGVATSKAIPDANNATQIADFMNKKLMSK